MPVFNSLAPSDAASCRNTAGANPTDQNPVCEQAMKPVARMHRERMFPCVSFCRSTVLRSIARRRAAASYLTVIGSRQLVAGNPFPPLVSLQSQSQGAPAGVFLFTRRQEAAAFAGSSSSRRGCSCCRRWSLAFFPGPGRRVAELRAGRGVLR